MSSSDRKIFVGYFESWSQPWKPTPEELQLANVAPYVNMVIVSFMRPNATYTKGSYELGKKDELTGLEFSVEGKQVSEAIALLKSKNPDTKVLVSIGGDTYSQQGYFENLNPQAIADVVEDLGFDGIDICYEPYRDATCSRGSDGNVSCTTDDLFSDIVSKVRQKLPRPYLLTLSSWSIGAYGEGQWKDSKPNGNGFLTGLMLNLLRSKGEQIDQLNVMSYNASTEYNLQEALEAYQNYFKGRIVMGIHVPPEFWPPERQQPGDRERHVYTISRIRELTQIVLDKNAAGVMLWSLQRQPIGAPTDNNPSPEMIAEVACQMLSLGNCNKPLFSN